MSVTPGVFTETTLRKARARADAMLLDDRIKQQFIPQYNVFNYIQSIQNAQLNAKFNERPGKQYEVELMWMNACDDFDDSDNSCLIDGTEVSTNAQTYTLDNRFAKSFKIADYQFRNNEFDAVEAMAKAMLRIDKLLAEEYSQYIVERLNIFAGENQVTDGKGSVIAGAGLTDIHSADWTAELMAYFSRVMAINKFGNAAMITGSNLYETLFVAQAKKADATGMGDWILWNGIPIWFDLFNIDGVNASPTATPTATPTGYVDDTGLLTYMVNRGAVAMASKAFNPVSPYVNQTDTRWQMPSKFMPGFSYDVFYQNSCLGESDMSTAETEMKDTLVHKWKIVLNADIFLNPYGCDEDENSGVLRFRNTATPTTT